jgi:hypothetical protein
MCDQGHNILFHSKYCKVLDADTGKTIAKEVITSGNVYVLEKGKDICCIGKTEERWIWHKIISHISCNNLVKLRIKYCV